MDFKRSLTHEIALNRSEGSTRKWILSDRLPMRSHLIAVKEVQENGF
jgi:hypothetical protein